MKAHRRLVAMAFAALAIAARLPFLVSGRMAFDSDEAVQGLMARHILNGEFPVFFWGQAFKGVPEAYVAAGAFAIAGSGVAILKGVTLAFFACYVGLNFVLLDTIASRWLAVGASLFLIAGPPALVFWSLDASAEYVLVMLLGTSFLLLCLRYQVTRSLRILGAIGVVTGMGLWTHQIFVFYLVPAVAIFASQGSWRQQLGLGRINVAARALGAIAALYLGLAAIAFFTGGFSLQLAGLSLAARAPQKMLRIGAAVAALAAAIHMLTDAAPGSVRRFARERAPLAAGFLLGYLPVLIFSVLVEPARSPARVAGLRDLVNAAPDLLGNVIPILSGFKIATTERLPIPLLAAAPIVAVLVAYVWSSRRRLTGIFTGIFTLRLHDTTLAADFFPLYLVFVPLLFLVSGAYLDTQSYRYLIPWYAGVCVALPAGSLALAGQRKGVASLVLGVLLAVSATQQVVWYRKLTPDIESPAILECLRRQGIRGGYADYWLSYKLTFLANEEIVVSPSNGVDRYPSYTELVRSLPPEARADDVALLCGRRQQP